MGKIVFMFPGQGAQYVGMGKDFYDSFACSKEIFDKANEVLDIDVKKLCFEENEDINITEYTQAAMVTELPVESEYNIPSWNEMLYLKNSNYQRNRISDALSFSATVTPLEGWDITGEMKIRFDVENNN